MFALGVRGEERVWIYVTHPDDLGVPLTRRRIFKTWKRQVLPGDGLITEAPWSLAPTRDEYGKVVRRLKTMGIDKITFHINPDEEQFQRVTTHPKVREKKVQLEKLGYRIEMNPMSVADFLWGSKYYAGTEIYPDRNVRILITRNANPDDVLHELVHVEMFEEGYLS